ncbi:hypothetical protein CFE70_001962 [Pyrenophora teres f. teres 0-1]
MTAQILAAELGNLIQDAKRKNTELRNAAEIALKDLKSLSNTSEAQLSAEKALEIPTVTEVKGDNDKISVRPAANDAYKMFTDLISLVVGEKPVHMRFSPLPPSSTLELIEAILSNHNEIMTKHPEQVYIMRSQLMPLIIRSLSDRLSFAVTVRIIRILHLIIRYHLDTLPSECEIALGLLNHMLDPEASQAWKRALCLEVFRSIYADSRLLLAIYALFDAKSEKKNIFGDNLAAFVRLATEKPAIIGLGQQSTAATGFEEGKTTMSDYAVAEAGALAGVIGGAPSDNSNNARQFGIIRAIQKFTQVAGLLRLSTPRDAFLTTMGKAAVPSNLLLANVSSMASGAGEKPSVFSNAKGMLSVDSFVSQASSMSTDKNRQPSHDASVPTLGPRNLLCIRALLNLAIALGPTLQSAWSIIFETLQVADLVMALSSQASGRAPGPGSRMDADVNAEKLEAETSAVQSAARRLFESTVDFPNESFCEVLQALCSLLNGAPSSESGSRTPTTSGRPQILQQRRLGSVSGISMNSDSNARDSAFALNKIGELATLNEARLSQYDPAESGWDILVREVIQFSTDDQKGTPTRLLAADILARTVKDIAEISMSDENREEIQARILAALQKQIADVHHNNRHGEDTVSETDIRVHQIALEALKSVIEQCGESLVAGWTSVIESLISVFAPPLPFIQEKLGDNELSEITKHSNTKQDVISRSLARSAFATANLICSDFMTAVPDACLSTLLELLRRFCSQREDLNMSLTAITFFWNVSDYIQSRTDLSSLPQVLDEAVDQEAIKNNSHVWSTEPLLKTAMVWKSYFSSPDAWRDADKEDNQDAFVAYAEAFKAIYRLSDRSLAQDLPSMLANLEACIVNSDEVAYSSDLDSMTTLQTRVMECLSMVKTEDTEIPPYLIRLLGRFIRLPYTSVEDFPDKRGPTFVALSKASMTLLQEITVKHVNDENIYSSNAMSFALMSLARPIQEKYSWQREGRAPTLWQKATRTAIAIIMPTLPLIGSQKETWATIVEIAQYMTRAHFSRDVPTTLEKDEQFDVDSFTQLRDLITLPLGSALLPDSLRRTYTHNLFSTSLAHSPLPGELPNANSSPLDELYKIRLGQTAELECTSRPSMGFTCLSELFRLVAVQDSNAERVKLAQAAAPYLILRCALPLKTYIADHPLRGRMPAPDSQTRELLFVLSELGKLESEPQAIPDAPGACKRTLPVPEMPKRTGRDPNSKQLTDVVVAHFSWRNDTINANDDMSPQNGSSNTTKRKSDDSAPGQQRTTSQQVDDLFHNLNTLRSNVEVQSNGSMGTSFNQEYRQTPMMPPQPERSQSRSFSKHPRFHGPTSNAFNVGVARSSLKTMGINASDEGEDEGALTQDATPRGSPLMENTVLPKRPMHTDKDPIWSVSKHEALRLVHVWHDEMGVMYPILEVDKLLGYTEMLFTFVEAAARSGLMQGALPGSDAMMDEQISILKLVLAITLVLEGGGKHPLGEKLFANVHKVVDRALSEPVSLHGITLLVLTLGLHRRDTYTALFPDPEERAAALRMFWIIYVLDRRWSFGTGMPFALQDADIEKTLPKPAYIHAMISYSVIGSKVWKSASDVGHQDKINKEDISFLDFQVLNWHRSIPESLKFIHPDSGRQVEPPGRLVHRLQVVLYLRANQMRILIYRPVLHTANTIIEHLEFAHVVVKVAKDTIRILTYINQTSDIYRSQQTMFNYFLISALAVLFLAVAHAPAEFSQQARDEFYMALELVRGLSSNSYVSKRLWKTIKTIKEVGPRLGLFIRNDDTNDAHSSAAVAMAGLAGHSMDELALYSSGRNAGGLDTPNGMACDLTTLFEAAGGIFNMNGFGGPSSSELSNANGEFVNGFRQENDELAQILRELF